MDLLANVGDYAGGEWKLGKSKEYRAWLSMRDACKNKVQHLQRGIRVSQEWDTSFSTFLNDIGYAPSEQHTLDRIDNYRGYEAGNVRWATRAEQARNTTRNRNYTFRGQTKCLTDWAKEIGCSPSALSRRLDDGETMEQAASAIKDYFGPITWRGETMRLAAWARRFGCKWCALRKRLLRGMSIDEAFSRPVRSIAGKKPMRVLKVRKPPRPYASREYRSWKAMRERCRWAAKYVKKGIRVCQEWQESFDNFLADVGAAPSFQHSIDRIDNTRGYEPGNVRWATSTEQCRNRSISILLTCNGETKCLNEWLRQTGLNNTLVRRRLFDGWTHEQSLGFASPPSSRPSSRPMTMAPYYRKRRGGALKYQFNGTMLRTKADLAFAVGVSAPTLLARMRCGETPEQIAAAPRGRGRPRGSFSKKKRFCLLNPSCTGRLTLPRFKT